VKSATDVPFGGFVKNAHPYPQQPPNSENFALKSSFPFRTRINLDGGATKIRIRIGNSPWDFTFGVKSLTGSRFLAVSAHGQQKIGMKKTT